ncbi:MAG: outer membrane beta-barrel protein [Candidatus Aminicenantes bacterium]|nr:outer membrane beta-barrel protein [Candidatus Aminicenantes bacterium]
MTRKAIFIFVLVMALGVLPTSAQQNNVWNKFEVTPFVGFHFGGKIRTREGDITLKDGAGYGVIVDISVRPGAQVEFLYSHQPTELRLNSFVTGGKEVLFDAAMDYWQIGGLMEFYRGGMAKPFGVMTLGLTHLNSKEVGASSETRFSFGFGGGVKAQPSKHIGFRAEGRLYFTYISGGSGLWCGLPGGCWITLGGEAMVQGQLNAGVIIAF